MHLTILPKQVQQKSRSSSSCSKRRHVISMMSPSLSQRTSIRLNLLIRMSMLSLSAVVLLFISDSFPCVTSFQQNLFVPVTSSSYLWSLSSSFGKRRYYYGDCDDRSIHHRGYNGGTGIRGRQPQQRVRQQSIIALRSTVAHPLPASSSSPSNTNRDDKTSIPQSSSIQKKEEDIHCSNSNQDDDDSSSTTPEKGMSIYVHIPYCRKRCLYCDFAIVPIGTAASSQTDDDDDDDDTNSSDDTRTKRVFQKMDASYRDAIVSEIALISKYATTVSDNISEKTTTTKKKKKIPLRSIYFGGGTPSLAPLDTLQSILDAILNSPDSAFYHHPEQLMEPMEITIEMDPGTFSLSKLHALKAMGFNRISLGVQSFDDTILESIGRVHRYRDIIDAVDMIGQVFGRQEGGGGGTVNYSLDLISGLPGLSCAKWIETLQMALELEPPPDHLSLYDLQVESGTVFGKWYEDAVLDDDDDDDDDDDGEDSTSGDISRTRLVPTIDTTKNGKDRIPLPSAEDCAFMYRFASGYLRSKGFEHYEISSYARVVNDHDDDTTASSKRSRHNQVYWEVEGEWYAVGMGAASSLSGKRYSRPRQLTDYVDWITKEKEKSRMLSSDNYDGSNSSYTSWVPGWLSEVEGGEDDGKDDNDMLFDVILTRLRTKDGLDLGWIEKKQEERGFHNLLEKVLHGAELGLELGFLKVEKNRDNDGSDFLYLTDPDGFLFSNSVISSIFAEIL